MILLLLLILFLSQFTLSSLLFIYSSLYFCNCYHQGYCFSYRTCGCCHCCCRRCCLGLRHLYCCYCYNVILVAVFAVVSSQVVSFVIVVVFATIVSIAICGVGFVFLFWVFSVCRGYCVTSLCIPFIYSLQLFSYSPTIYFR